MDLLIVYNLIYINILLQLIYSEWFSWFPENNILEGELYNTIYFHVSRGAYKVMIQKRYTRDVRADFNSRTITSKKENGEIARGT